jgi:hypothetical protein
MDAMNADMIDTVCGDLVNKPSHYTRYAIEPVTFIMRNDLPFHVGNIVKYAVRAGYKVYPNMDEPESEITDLKKVIRYAEMRINLLEGETEL